jgi:cytosine/adenosine deaminase-related metal-dependent hydrolase
MENSGGPAKLRELVRRRKEQGADPIKIFASRSIREGGAQTMTAERQDTMAALISATALSAESLNLGDRIDTIAPNMQADIAAFDGNDLQHVTAAGRAVFVMKAARFTKIWHGALSYPRFIHSVTV